MKRRFFGGERGRGRKEGESEGGREGRLRYILVLHSPQ